MPQTPLKGPILGRNIFGHSVFKIELLALWSEASSEGMLGNKCLLLVEYKQFQKRRTKGVTHCILATDKSTIFTGNKNFIKHGFHHILCSNPRGALYTGGWLNLFGVWDFGWEKIFSKVLIWTTVKGVDKMIFMDN